MTTTAMARERNEDFKTRVTPAMIQERASRYNISLETATDQLWNDYIEYEFEED